MTTAASQPNFSDDFTITVEDGIVRYRGVSAPKRAVLKVLGLAALFVAFTYQAFALLIDRWNSDANYGHGYLIPFIAIYFVWASRESLLTPASPEREGVFSVIAGAAMLLAGGVMACFADWRSWSGWCAAIGAALLAWQGYNAWKPTRDFAGVEALLADSWKRVDRFCRDVVFGVPVRLTAILIGLRPEPWLWGLPVFLIGLPLVFLALPLSSAVLAGIAVVIIANGLALYLGGRRVYRALWLPVIYLIFMVPLPQGLYDSLANPLQRFASTMSANILDGIMGIPVTREGNVINVPGPTAVHPLQVAEACSGMRSIMGLLALGVAFAWFWERALWERIFLIVSTVPIAILANICRVTATGYMYHIGRERLAQGLYHELTGWFVFLFAMVLFLIEVWVLDKIFVHETPSAGATSAAGGRA